MRNTLSLLSGTPNSIFTARGRFLNPRTLFTSGEEGAWYDPSDISVLFQDTAGTTPITASGQTIARVNDKSGNGLNATQATIAARPSYIVDTDGAFLQHDPIDDALTVTLPDLGTEATVAYVTRSEVRLLEDQTISGSYTLPAQELANFVVIDRALTFAEKVSLIRFLAAKVEGVNYGAEIDRLTLIAVNAVDVFVYDTSKDSDGGAWRTGALAQSSSWYNETLNTATRGSRREFPEVAVIVAESNKVTIYDGDDPTLPMWMVFEGGGDNWLYYVNSTAKTSSIFAINGKIVSGNELYDVRIWDFLTDGSVYWRERGVADYYGTVSQRNDGLGQEALSSGSSGIVNRAVNDVAMAVLPDAPTDPATGLPVPTIAVATDGGVSVIKDDGTVTDSAETGVTNVVCFVENNGIWYARLSALFYSTVEDYQSDGFGDRLALTFEGSEEFDLLTPVGSLINFGDNISFGAENPSTDGVAGFALHQPNYTDQSKGMSALLTSTYTTGWMPGNIKGAFLSDTDDTDLVGSGELVTNGTFDTDTTGWTAGANTTLSVVSNRLRVTNVGTNYGYAYQAFTTVIGKTYTVSVDITYNAGRARVLIANGPNLTSGGQIDASATGTYTYTFVASATTTYINVGNRNDTDVFNDFDNISVKLADEDRSVNANGLVIEGTITRTPVATGADLVAYSGFSASNYLEGTDASYADTLYALGWEQTGGVWEFKHGVVSTAPIDGLTITGTTLKIAGTKPKALIRLTATTPSAEQLAKIEADEGALFQDNAQATLYGASDAVTALAHDPDTDLLHVGTSAGRSIFDGLRRVGNTTTSVSTAISATGGLVVEK